MDTTKHYNVWASIIIPITVTIITSSVMYGIYLQSENETHPNLIISYVNDISTYDNITQNDGTYNLYKIKKEITLYNTKRSDYPARIVSVKSKIHNTDKNRLIVDNNYSSFISHDDRIIGAGESVKFETEIYNMELNKTGNYTSKTIIKYVDLKDSTLKSIGFYCEFEIKEKYDFNLKLYRPKYNEVGNFDEQWAIIEEQSFDKTKYNEVSNFNEYQIVID